MKEAADAFLEGTQEPQNGLQGHQPSPNSVFVIEGIPNPILVGYSFRFEKADDLLPDSELRLRMAKIFFDPQALAFQSKEVEIGQTPFTLAETEDSGVYELAAANGQDARDLEFYDPATGFVFFPKDAIDSLLLFKRLNPSWQLVISGCRIQFGQSAQAFNGGADPIDPKKFYFTLKIEIRQAAEANAAVNEGAGENFPAAVMATGYPCPPRWYQGSLLQELAQAGVEPTADNLQKTMKSWEELLQPELAFAG